MKRLLFYLNRITEQGTTTFRYTVMEEGRAVKREIYDGECVVVRLKPNGDPVSDRTGIRREPTYWSEDISFTFERTGRMKLDRPTVTIAIPCELLGITEFTPAAADFCLRRIKPYYDVYNETYYNKSRPDCDNGKFFIHAPDSEVLVRNTAYFAMKPAKDYTDGRGALIYEYEFSELPPDRRCLCIRMEIQLPHNNLKRAKKMLTDNLTAGIKRYIDEFDINEFNKVLKLERKQNKIREYLRENGYCSFIANGSILPREKKTNLPMKNALPFKSTAEDEIEIAGVRGMGIKRGVTVITGGGYSGKSTVLNAISAGINNHIAGDGRELCITDDTAVTITAEDGRAVSALNISPFIKWIPDGDSREFTTNHASGSTSQAANIMEAIDCGSKLLLIDEDRSATNFMIRDALMKELIKKEPITPFTDRVRELGEKDVSTILVIGGSGEYLSVADKIYMMDDFVINDVTQRAKNMAHKTSEPPNKADWKIKRIFNSEKFTSYPQYSGTEKLEISDTGFIIIGGERIDIRALHDISSPQQVNALAFMLRFLMRSAAGDDEMEALALAIRGLNRKTLNRKIDPEAYVRELYAQISSNGLDVVDTGFFNDMERILDLPREIELRALINRMRRISWEKAK